MENMLNNLLRHLGIQVKRVKSLTIEKKYYENVVNGGVQLYQNLLEANQVNEDILAIVFSKDRPLQLEVFLRSYFYYGKNCSPITVLYKAGNENFGRAYDKLKIEMAPYDVTFIEEHDFKSQLITCCEKSFAERLVFYTDDGIFLEEFDLNDCLAYNSKEFIFCLRFGRDLTYSFVLDKDLQLPEMEDTGNNLFIGWKWMSEELKSDWSYPLSVDGSIFNRKDILAVLNSIDFRNPSTLEANMQVFSRFFACKNGVSYPKSKLVNIPCNLVQTEIKNRSTAIYTTDELLQIWEEGKRIDIAPFHRMSMKKAIFLKFEFIDVSASA